MGKTVEVSRMELECISKSIDSSCALIDLVVHELRLQHEQQGYYATPYQLQILLETVDRQLLDQWERIRELSEGEGVPA